MLFILCIVLIREYSTILFSSFNFAYRGKGLIQPLIYQLSWDLVDGMVSVKDPSEPVYSDVQEQGQMGTRYDISFPMAIQFRKSKREYRVCVICLYPLWLLPF